MSCVYSLAHSIDHLNLLKFWNKNLDTHQRFIILLLLFILAFNQREEKNPKREIILVNDEKN
jgi:hypothetical protein